MDSKSVHLIISILVLSFMISTCPQSEACLKKVRSLLRKKGKEEKPAELAADEASFIKYSHAERSSFYLEIIRHPNHTVVVRELDHPPIALSQVKVEQIQKKKDGITTPEEPDAEYIDTNKLGDGGESTSTQSSGELFPIPPPSEDGSVATEDGELGSEEEILAPEDESVRKEWGGKCLAVDWNRCNKIRQIVVLDVINNQFMRKNLELDCLLEPILCLRNGWTANRCHILCMASQCNKQLYFEWDTIVDFEGPCRYRK